MSREAFEKCRNNPICRRNIIIGEIIVILFGIFLFWSTRQGGWLNELLDQIDNPRPTISTNSPSRKRGPTCVAQVQEKERGNL